MKEAKKSKRYCKSGEDTVEVLQILNKIWIWEAENRKNVLNLGREDTNLENAEQ